jgi:uncharacterized protein YjbI with pentapeptide repeats
VDFTGADLTEALFDSCDLQDAVFEQTMLEGADLSAAFHFQIDPSRNKVRKMKVTESGLYGLVACFGVVVDRL